MTTDDNVLFDVMTPLGFRVRVTVGYWNVIVTIKHPVMAGRERDVEAVLAEPDEIRQSKKDAAVYLFYSHNGQDVGSVPSRGG